MTLLQVAPSHLHSNQLKMPLPGIKRFCSATCRATGEPCKNPAAFNFPVCRYHGAHPPETVARGAEHGRYKTGNYTQATKEEYRAASVRLLDLEAAAMRMGLIRGKKTPGRKPGLSSKSSSNEKG